MRPASEVEGRSSVTATLDQSTATLCPEVPRGDGQARLRHAITAECSLPADLYAAQGRRRLDDDQKAARVVREVGQLSVALGDDHLGVVAMDPEPDRGHQRRPIGSIEGQGRRGCGLQERTDSLESLATRHPAAYGYRATVPPMAWAVR